MKVGSVIARSKKYSRHTRESIRLSFGTMIPPNARAKREKAGNNQYIYNCKREDIREYMGDDIPKAFSTRELLESHSHPPTQQQCRCHHQRSYLHWPAMESLHGSQRLYLILHSFSMTFVRPKVCHPAQNPRSQYDCRRYPS